MTHQTTPIPPGAEVVNGVAYLPSPKGNLRRLDNIPAKDMLVHEQVYRMVGYALGMNAEIARFKSHTYGDLDALDALMAQEYNVTRDQEAKGNRTYTSADGKFQVRIKVNTPVKIDGSDLQQAKALINELVLERGEAADPVLAALVTEVFDVSKEGRVNVDLLRRLRGMEIADRRWPDIKRAITAAIKDGVSKSYITFHRWNGTRRGWEMIPLDMAAVEITDDAFDHPSLRRQVEEMTAREAELLRLARWARSALSSPGGLSGVEEALEQMVELLMGGDPAATSQDEEAA